VDWLIQNYQTVYILLIGVLLFLSYSFLQRSQYDERRRNRFRRKYLAHRWTVWQEKLYNQEYETFLRRHGIPLFINSVRINALRIGVLVVLIIIVLFGVITGKAFLSMLDLVMWGSLSIILIPKKPYPLFYMVKFFQRKHANEVSNEVYQLYNEIKSQFQMQSNGLTNTYYIIQQTLPYYKYIRTPLEKMLPLLEKKHLHEAWEVFANEIDTPESKMLGVVMKEVEATGTEQALLLLEQKRQEFSNNLYNRYTDYLRRRKTIIFTLVVFGAMMVFLNEVTVFYMWYKDIMTNVNEVSTS